MTHLGDVPPTGLTKADVDQRIADGRVNAVPDAPRRTFGQTLFANAVTPVNGIIGVMLALILIAGHPRDALFAGVVVSNTVIGVAQELSARPDLATTRAAQCAKGPRGCATMPPSTSG